MNENTLGFYDALSKGGVGDHRGRGADRRLPAGLPLAPSLPHGRRQVHPRHEAARRPHPQQRLPDLHADGARRSLAEPAVPQPSGHVRRPAHRRLGRATSTGSSDFHRDMIRPLDDPRDRGHHPQVHRRRRARAEGRLRRRRPQHGQHPHHHELPVALVEPARRRVRGHARRSGPSWLVDIVSGIKKRCGDDFPIVVCVNGFESGYLLGEPDDKVFNHDLALETMGMARRRRRRRPHDPQQLAGPARARLPARLPVLPRSPGAGGQDAARSTTPRTWARAPSGS